MKHIIKSLLFILSVLVGISFLGAQSLQDNENYKKALELLQMAKDEYEKGDYDKGYEYSEQSKEYLKLAEKEFYLEKLIAQAKKNNELAKQKLMDAEKLGAIDSEDAKIKDWYAKAGTALEEGTESFGKGGDASDDDQKIGYYEEARDKFEESSKYAGKIISELIPNPERDEAGELLKQASEKRDNILANEMIEENDKDDTNIMNALNKANEYYDNQRYAQSKENSFAALAYMDNIEKNKAKKDDADKMLAEAFEKRDKLLTEEIMTEGDKDDSKVVEVLNKSKEEFDNEEYLNSIESSEKAMAMMDVIMDKEKYKAEAEKMLAKVEEALKEANEREDAEQYVDIISNAGDTFDEAKAAYESEDYNDSINFSIKAMNILAEMMPSLPKYYRVRLIPHRRDCLWRIAEYYFVYEDAYKWNILYDHNKSKLKYPDNPHLIYPGQIFEIPSISGEKRNGEYDPNKDYPRFKEVVK